MLQGRERKEGEGRTKELQIHVAAPISVNSLAADFLFFCSKKEKETE
jgi:hypothetical protein